jgi:F5/8 type C domain
MKNIFLLFILFVVLFIQSVHGVDIADKEVQYIPYKDKKGTLDVVFCSENDYFRKAEFTLGYACYKAIDKRTQGFGTRVDHLNKGDYSIFELAAVSEISKIEMMFYKGQARQYDIKIQVAVAGAHVQGDENSVKWKTVFSGKTPNVGGTEENPDPVVFNFDTPIEGQFIRIIGNGNYLDGSNTLNGDHTSYSDIQIFGTMKDEVYTYQNTS